jgi:hypothetical protein
MDTILAVDLGKFNSVLCWFRPDSRDARFRTVAATSCWCGAGPS